jgi:hypothetical protein
MGSERSNSGAQILFNQASGASYLILDKFKNKKQNKKSFIESTARPLAFRIHGQSERNVTASSCTTFSLDLVSPIV